MPKRSRTKPLRRSESHPTKKAPRVVSKAHQIERDENQMAFDAVQRLLERTKLIKEKNPAAVALGRLGGLKGGTARAKKLTAEQRRESARNAANIRWRK